MRTARQTMALTTLQKKKVPFNICARVRLWLFIWMVSFRVKVWITYIVFLSNGIFRFQNESETPFSSSVVFFIHELF